MILKPCSFEKLEILQINLNFQQNRSMLLNTLACIGLTLHLGKDNQGVDIRVLTRFRCMKVHFLRVHWLVSIKIELGWLFFWFVSCIWCIVGCTNFSDFQWIFFYLSFSIFGDPLNKHRFGPFLLKLNIGRFEDSKIGRCKTK